MGFGSLSGALGLGGESKDSKTTTNMTTQTPEQKKLMQDFIAWLSPNVGKAATPYTGNLPGTSGPSAIQSNLFDQAQQGTGPFAAYSNLWNPEAWNQRVAEQTQARQALLEPEREKAAALYKEGAAKMGLASDSSTLKGQVDLRKQWIAEDDLYAQQLYDKYEQLGLQVTPEAINTLTSLGAAQREITEAGLSAQFQEWLRTQPEYSPYIDTILSILGMQPVKVGTSKTSEDSFAWSTGLGGTIAGAL